MLDRPRPYVSAVKVTVRCFASVREMLGADTLEVEVPDGATVRDLKDALARRAPDLERLTLACAVNRDYAQPERPLVDGDEVAFIPPISGGSTTELFPVRSRRWPARPARARGRGAHRRGRGDRDVRRRHPEPQRRRAVQGLSYEAYHEMASRVMVELFEQAVAQFEIGRARVAHRLGEVPIGEASVLVVVAAPHRGAAFDACRFLMDHVKAEVPIFKKERLADGGGDERWVGELPEGKPQID